MNTKPFFSVSRLIAMTLTFFMAVCFAACSGDEDSDDSFEKKILGTWVCQNASYMFNSDGTGIYDTGGDLWGHYKYSMSGSSVYMRITYVNSKYGNVWHDEISGDYHSNDDTFWVDRTKYVRKK